MGSTMPCFDAFASASLGVDHRNRIADGVGHIQAAAVRVHRQRLRLGAKVALPRQPRIEIALHGERRCPLPDPH
jgi:hypothetical protein